MGYTTDFKGEWKVTPALKPEHKAYLAAFADVRHMQRDEQVVAKLEDKVREAVGLPIGTEGAFYVGGHENSPWGDNKDKSPDGVLNYNHQAVGQPGLWCQWTPNEDGTAILWDGGEKFYHYVEWINYIITNFLTPWGYVLNGKVKWQGEERSDKGYIYLWNNRVYINEEPNVLEKIVDATTKQTKKEKKS